MPISFRPKKLRLKASAGLQIFQFVPHPNGLSLGHRMGVGASVDLAVPPGGSTLVLMNPTECIQTKPKIDSTQKPLCLSTLGDAEWNEWMGKLQHIVNRYLSEMLPFFLVPLAAIPMLWDLDRRSGMAFPGIPIYAMFLAPLPWFFWHNRLAADSSLFAREPRSGNKKLKGAY